MITLEKGEFYAKVGWICLNLYWHIVFKKSVHHFGFFLRFLETRRAQLVAQIEYFVLVCKSKNQTNE